MNNRGFCFLYRIDAIGRHPILRILVSAGSTPVFGTDALVVKLDKDTIGLRSIGFNSIQVRVLSGVLRKINVLGDTDYLLSSSLCKRSMFRVHSFPQKGQ